MCPLAVLTHPACWMRLPASPVRTQSSPRSDAPDWSSASALLSESSAFESRQLHAPLMPHG